MTKDDHTMIRAAIATKKKYGSVTLTDEQKQRCELVSGQKFENTWLADDEYSITSDFDAEGAEISTILVIATGNVWVKNTQGKWQKLGTNEVKV